MSQSGLILEYRGPVDFDVTESLLSKLKKAKGFTDLDKTTARRVYALVVECLENISKHTAIQICDNKNCEPHISVCRENDKVIISSENRVNNCQADKVAVMLDHLNRMDQVSLKIKYEHKINRETLPEENGAGLGFIIMRMKSGNKIDYGFTNVGNDLSYFKMKISINRYTMRKLIIEQTSNSPKVILDPDENHFEISGESRPPDVIAFYSEILNWFDDYSSYLGRLKDDIKPVVFNFDFEYYNSSSAKFLLDFCKKVSALQLKGQDITVKWRYEENDIDMLEAGREMSKISKMPFEYVQKDIK
jgi:hypothetical protein